ncbi:molybdopterin-binding protein [Paenibacillus sp. J31TS4]|uniref:molybdopterin-binding protein n=1 Tax=Paenibacillus sp. J31TS4 TaxID=2807195 RepID=UPI001AFD1602|nr:molybdopterin-binding protein [Paenibacillus sp. J31TS4]GIP39979.1 molybdopterin-binding protein [Paenibacillus sp. J31TS4]
MSGGQQPPLLREVRVEDAIGLVLAHDLTQIVPGRFKGRLFRKGHVLQEEDIPALLDIGKEHIYVLELRDGFLHENDAAARIAAAACGPNLELTEPHEGKITLKSAIHGLARVSRGFVDEVNGIDRMVLSTIPDRTVVRPGQAVAATRVIPLVIETESIVQIEQLTVLWREKDESSPLLTVKPFRPLRVGLITTGSEVYKGRITDKFGPVVRDKVSALGSEVVEQRLSPDDSETIVSEIRYFQNSGVDLILLTGGMSVDPDDRTPGAIRRAGARVVSYGTPMLPGSMLMMAYLGDIPVMGLPGCVMHDPYTSFDVLLPRICAGETIERADITALGYGGLGGC